MTQFVKDYADAQHSLEWFEFSGGAAFEVILTALLAIATGGVGAIASLGTQAKKISQLKKLGKLLSELAEKLKNLPKDKPTRLRKLKAIEDRKAQKAQKPAPAKAAAKQEKVDGTADADDGRMREEEVVSDSAGPKIDMHHVQGEVNPNKWIPKLKMKMPSGTGGHYLNSKIRVTNEITPRNSLGVYEAQIDVFDSANNAWVPKLNPKGKLGKSTMFSDNWGEPKIIQQIQEAYIDAGAPSSGKWTGQSSSGLKIQGYVDETSKPFDVRTAWPVYEDI